jgi:type IV pilus assembly protein PilZ
VQDRRVYERKTVIFTLEFAVESGTRTPGICNDLSIGGMRIETQNPAPFGAKVTVHVQFPKAKIVSALPGTVRWINDGQMGVQFDMIGAYDTHIITQIKDAMAYNTSSS